MPSRRQFLRVGAAGAAVLFAAHWLRDADAAPAEGYRVLDARAARIVAALAPVVLAGALPIEGRERHVRDVVAAFDRAVGAMSPAVRGEVAQLFSVLAFRPSRVAMAGLWQPIERSDPEAIAAFLASWRRSRFDLQRQAYQALTQLLQAAWYDNPAAWPAILYPGPPKVP